MKKGISTATYNITRYTRRVCGMEKRAVNAARIFLGGTL